MFAINAKLISETGIGLHWISSSIALLIAATIVWLLPNSYQILKRYKPAILPPEDYSEDYLGRWQWTPTWRWNIIMVFAFVLAVVNIQASSIFLYFRF